MAFLPIAVDDMHSAVAEKFAVSSW